jgi:hypothetical protein
LTGSDQAVCAQPAVRYRSSSQSSSRKDVVVFVTARCTTTTERGVVPVFTMHLARVIPLASHRGSKVPGGSASKAASIPDCGFPPP